MPKQNKSRKKSSSSKRQKSYPPRHITLVGIAIIIVAVVFAIAILLEPLYPVQSRLPQAPPTSTTG